MPGLHVRQLSPPNFLHTLQRPLLRRALATSGQPGADAVFPSVKTIGADGQRVVEYSDTGAPSSQSAGPRRELVFVEEPLGLPRAYRFGYMGVDIGDTLGAFAVVRKLGYGQYSTVWLARDTR